MINTAIKVAKQKMKKTIKQQKNNCNVTLD